VTLHTDDKLDTAVIVAAGLSSRLYPVTENIPKCLLEVAGESMIRRSVRNLQACGIENIHVVTGFMQQRIADHLNTDARYILNPFYASCNNMASLWFARHAVADKAFVYMHADVLYEPQLLRDLVAAPRSAIELLVDFGPVDYEAMKVLVVDDRFVCSNKEIPLEKAAGEWTGLARFSAEGADTLFQKITELLAAGHLNDYDTLAFSELADQNVHIGLTATNAMSWIEIDDHEDMIRAREMFK